jgi:hypothetical protein
MLQDVHFDAKGLSRRKLSVSRDFACIAASGNGSGAQRLLDDVMLAP